MFSRLSRKPLRFLGPTGVGSAIFVYAYNPRVKQRNDSSIAHAEDYPGEVQVWAVGGGGNETFGSPKPEAIAQPDKWSSASAWDSFSSRFSNVSQSIRTFEWSSVGDSITDFIMPDWAKLLPGYVAKLQDELDMAPGSLAAEIWEESQDPYINPEIIRRAHVRIGKDLCYEEKIFRARRKEHTTKALAKYLGLREGEVHPEDVPTIALCASGGGLRALTAGSSSYLSTQEAGLFDCVTYTAGVSGSCWMQTLYNSSIGNGSHAQILQHLKKRNGTHIAFPPTALGLMTLAPTNKFLLSGFVEKLKAHSAAVFGLVDIYGLLLGARLLVPHGDLDVNDMDLKLSNQRRFVDGGAHPMPIYTAVRHELPMEEETQEGQSHHPIPEKIKEEAKRESWFQWFEFTPYEFWCEEFEAGIPTWSIGRAFSNGIDVPREETGLSLPELRVPLLMGIWGSAFCATLYHYYKEIRPLVKSLAGFSDVDGFLSDRNDDLIKVHPIAPASMPSFTLGLEDRLPSTCPKSVFQAEHLELMDAGMSNNLPIYPLLRPGRNVDILIAFDASADIKRENWLSVADGYAKQRGIKGWPIGAGWPSSDTKDQETSAELEAASSATAQEAASKVAAAREEQRRNSNITQESATSQPDKNATQDPKSGSDDTTSSRPTTDLGYCTIWLGTTQERTSTSIPPPSKVFPNQASEEEDWSLLSDPNAGIAVIYFPFLPNPAASKQSPLPTSPSATPSPSPSSDTEVPEPLDIDPNTTPFLSTWNFVYTPEEIDAVVALARANFKEGEMQTKRVVRAVYERRKKERLRREEEMRGVWGIWGRRWR
ncbi:hypothetical protein MMC25_002899 [Agyrium rufum]|nr:hypothetical protein [Agyrium rufum]